jgi:nucleoside 2-deoxyribosyltransferase
MKRIYIASSWKNAARVRALADLLRARGHEVFDFTDPDTRREGFENYLYSASRAMGKPREMIEYTELLAAPETRKAFRSDKAGLDWADTVVLLLPCGRSAHLEAGYGVGQGKQVHILGDLPLGEFEVMYMFAERCYHEADVGILLARLEER